MLALISNNSTFIIVKKIAVSKQVTEPKNLNSCKMEMTKQRKCGEGKRKYVMTAICDGIT